MAHARIVGFVASVTDSLIASTAPTVAAIAAVLVVLGIVLVIVAFRLLHHTRSDHAALGPLEEMGERGWLRSDPLARAAMIDRARPPGAEPIGPEPSVQPALVAAVLVASNDETATHPTDGPRELETPIEKLEEAEAPDMPTPTVTDAEVAKAAELEVAELASEDLPPQEVAEKSELPPPDVLETDGAEPAESAGPEPLPAPAVAPAAAADPASAGVDADTQWMPPPDETDAPATNP